jgi:hypothetical protein
MLATQQEDQTQARSIAASSSSSPSPTGASQHHHSHHHHHQKSSPAGRRVSSPGYHSAASSPGSSVSSLVSSSASSASSSGVSSAASDHQRPIPSPTCSLSSSSSTSGGSGGAAVAAAAAAAMMMSIATSTANALDRHNGQHHQSNQTAHLGNTASNTGGRQQAASFGTSQQQQQQSQQGQTGLPFQQHRQACQPVTQQQQQQQQQANGGCNQPNLLDYYPEAQQDGLNLSWFHGANSRQMLSRALASGRSIVTGDISLAELSRYPVPIMARPPLGVSDLTLENWLSDVIQARKGIKLTFTSTRTVEPAFRVLARHAEHLTGPIILSADILARPTGGQNGGGKQAGGGTTTKQQQQHQQQQQPVDAWTFLMLCRTRFPKSIISIGWCPLAGGQQQPQRSGPIGVESVSGGQPADSSTAGESMFELDMMLDGHQHQHHHHLHHHQQQQPQQQQQQQHFGQSFGQRPSLSSLSVVQQLAAVAAAAAANNAPQQQQQQVHPRVQPHNYVISSTGSLNSSSGNSSGSPSPTSPISHMLMSPAHLQQHLQRHPQSHHQHQHQYHLQHHHQRHVHHQHQPSSAEQLMLAAAAMAESNKSGGAGLAGMKQQVMGWPTTVAAMVSSSGAFKQLSEQMPLALNGADDDDEEGRAGSERHQQNEDGPEANEDEPDETGGRNVGGRDEQDADGGGDEVDDDEVDGDDGADDDSHMPLNLNINEADPQHASSTLNELAQQIKSLQQQSSNLNTITSSLVAGGGQPVAALSLASKLFASTTAAGLNLGQAEGEQQQQQHLNLSLNLNQCRWEHVSKKAALANRLNSNSPSPVSTSPKQQQQQQLLAHQNNLLCVKASTSLANLAAAQQQQLAVKQEPSQQLAGPNGSQVIGSHQQRQQQQQPQMGYTREMIDKMASLVKEYNLTQPITFPVEARLLNRNNNSLAELQRLLYQVGTNSTLTVVAQPEDLISVDDLLTIRKHFATNQVLFDLPDELTASLRHELELL